MPAVTSYKLTGDAYIDGVLGDTKWAVNSFTYSFPTSGSYYGKGYGSGENTTNFGALNSAQQAATRAALDEFASVANLSFTEIGETSTQHADLRFAMSDKPATAWAYFPSTDAEGGDAWFNRSSGDYAKPLKGNYAFATFLHEIGHALGLEHAHEAYKMPENRDSMEFTVMSYRSYVGASLTGGYTNETGGYAQSLMMYDIAALQHMYGADFTTNGGDTTYRWSATTGEAFINGVGQGAPVANRIFETVWDGGGVDTYDFSNYATNLKVDLRPGQWITTSTAQLARLHWDGSKIAVGNIANALLHKGDLRSLVENAVGGSGNDVIVGNQVANTLHGGTGNDRLTGGAGEDILEAGAGTDTAVFSGQLAAYSVIQLSDGSVQIADLRSGAPNGKDTLRDVELFQFSDGLYKLEDLTLAATTSTATSDGGKTLVGDAGDNTLSGGAEADNLDGLGGNDALRGRSGDDELNGARRTTPSPAQVEGTGCMGEPGRTRCSAAPVRMSSSSRRLPSLGPVRPTRSRTSCQARTRST